MNLTLDNCSSISANGSSSTSATSTDSNLICAVLFYTASIVMPVFVLPFNIWALYLGRRTVTKDGRSASSDILILNMVSTCVIVCLTYTLFLINYTYMIQSLTAISMLFDAIGSMAQAQFHSWICVEHCLAVVFPVFYLKFKQRRYRLVWISFTWVTSLLYGGLMVLLDSAVPRMFSIIPFFVMLAVILICSLATLAMLKQPSPGSGERREMHHLKTKAFRIITLILVVLIIGYYPYISVALMEKSLSSWELCVGRAVSFWLFLPGCVLHSLLFLSRFIKMPCAL